MKTTFFLIVVSILPLITACYYEPDKPCKCGMVVARNSFYKASTGEYISSQMNSPETKMWFKDSLAIIESFGFIINTDINGKTTTQLTFANYTFVDLRTESYYQYHSFSDTATIEKKFTPHNKDSLLMNTFMWTFFNTEINKTSIQEKELNDTTIDNTIYKRRQFLNQIHTKEEDWKDTVIGYYRCDKIGTLFTYGESYSKKMPCPMVKLQFLPTFPSHVNSATLSEIVYLSDTLTAKELKVFDAWEKNEKKYPISKSRR